MFSDGLVNGLEGSGERLRIFAAGFRHIGAAPPLPPTACATSPASLPACTLDVKSLVTAAMIETFESPLKQHNYARLPFIAQRIGQRAQLLALHASSLAASTFTSLMVRACCSRSPRADWASFVLELLDLLFQRLLMEDRLLHVLDQLGSETRVALHQAVQDGRWIAGNPRMAASPVMASMRRRPRKMLPS